MLQLKNVNYSYANSKSCAVSNINLNIEKGRCFGLLGPNGAGKTTLIALMSGLLPLQQGDIFLDDLSIKTLSKTQAQKISVVPQEYAFYPQLTVFENMQFFASLYQINDKLFLQSLLDKVDLNRYTNAYAKHLSGGLKRRLNFAIALVNSPKIVFMDEITVGVDPLSRQFILNNVKELTEQGVTVIYTSHYLHEIELLCHNIAIVESGQLCFNGKISDILYQHTEQQCLVTLAKPISQLQLTKLNASIIKHDHYQTVTFSVIQDNIATLLQDLEPYQIQSIQYGYQSLESFYLDFLNHLALQKQSSQQEGLHVIGNY